jgi:MFS transporter, MCT family, solute carrier family 16 (monocarboxylic acid transporters), member 10
MLKKSSLEISCCDSQAIHSTVTTLNLTPSFIKRFQLEGDQNAWLVVVGSFLVYYSSFGIVNSFGFFQDYYQRGFLPGTTPSTIAFVGTLQIALMNSVSTVSGALCDMYGVKV